MYVDFHKYNYELVPENQVNDFKNRDMESYKRLLSKWFEDNLDSFVKRKWEIEEIHYLKNISDFIKLLREAEQLFEFGFYTGCISLVGVSSEDFCRYLSAQLGKPEYEGLTQFNRINNLKSDGLISETSHALLDDIRKIRNECLHYNQDFKRKDTEELKSDALTALNKLKLILKNLIGEDEAHYQSDLSSVISGIGTGDNIRVNEEMSIKVKNAVSHLLKFPIAFAPSSKIQIKTSVYEILEVDKSFDEITLRDLANQMLVIVEFPEEEQEYYQNKELQEGNIVSATLMSVIDRNGLTAEWTILDIDKIQKP